MVKLVHGDAVDIIKTIDGESIDLTVTSPPYDNLRTSYAALSFEAFQSIADHLYRITKQGGVVVWVVGDATIKGSETGTSFRQALYFKDVGFRLHDTMIYCKGGKGAVGSNLTYLQEFDYMFVLSKGRPKSINLIKDRPNKRVKKETVSVGQGVKNNRKIYETKQYGRRFNVWTVYKKERFTLHPAIFPERLARDHIISWSNPGDLVFDPFVGSGTTAVAAVELDRQFIGIDINVDYLAKAKERIENANVYAGAVLLC